jgi:carbamoyl-phosphate synthase small subunit
VTAHNHGFAVDAPLDEPTETAYGLATVSHVCLNDDVVEGMELRSPGGDLKAFSVQYHPEAAAGPHDAAYLFDRFVELMDAAVSRRSQSDLLNHRQTPTAVEEVAQQPSRDHQSGETD